jgi:hypothetical protein
MAFCLLIFPDSSPELLFSKVNEDENIFFSQHGRKHHVSGLGFVGKFLFKIVN